MAAQVGRRNCRPGHDVIVRRHLKPMAIGIAEVSRERGGMIEDPKGSTPIPEAQTTGVGQKLQEAGPVNPKGDPMPAGSVARPLGLTLEQRQFRYAAVRGDHERTARVLGPCLGPRHRSEPQSSGIPRGRLLPFGDEEFYVIQTARGCGRGTHS